MPPKKQARQQAKESNLTRSIRYSLPDKYEDLRLLKRPDVDKLYNEWNIKIDGFTEKTINVSKTLRDDIIPFYKYFDDKFDSSWENKIYNLHLPDGFNDFKSIQIEDIKKGKFLSSTEEASGEKIAQRTENGYLQSVFSLDTYKNLDDLTDPTNLDWLIDKEQDLIPDLLKQSKKRNWALATFNDKLKAIRRYMKIMLGGIL